MASCTCANPTAVSNAINNQTSKVTQATADAAENVRKTIAGADGTDDSGGTNKDAPHRQDQTRFCHWAAPEISDKGEFKWTELFQLAALAIAIANGIAQAEIASKQQDLADGYYQMAKYKWDRFSNKYMPLEKKLLNEVSTVDIRELDCDDDRQRAELSVNTAFDSLSQYLTRQARKLRLCIDPSMVGMIDHRRALALVDTENYNIQDDQWFTDFKNDQRWNRRSNVLNLGRNLSSEALKYGDVARSLYANVGAQIDKAASSLMGALGYYGARNDTYYPTTYMSGYGQQTGNAGMIVGTVSGTVANAMNTLNPAGG